MLEVADTGDPAYDALHALLTTPPEEAGLLTGFNVVDDPAWTIDVASVTHADGVITVDLTGDPWDQYPHYRMARPVRAGMAVQQLVHTAQAALDTKAPLTLTVGGEPVRGVLMHGVDWPVAADPAVVPLDAEAQAPRVVDLPTSDWTSAQMAMAALTRGRLLADDDGCPYLRDGAGRRTYPIWPAGYSATVTAQGVVTVTRADGLPVAVSGDRLTLGGGEPSVHSTPACIPSADADQVWLVQEELPSRAAR